jgi:hypothetical protein
MFAQVCFEFAQKVEKLDWVDYFSKRTTMPQQWMDLYPHVIHIHQLLCPNGEDLDMVKIKEMACPYQYFLVQLEQDNANQKQFCIDKNGTISLHNIVDDVPSFEMVVRTPGLLLKMLDIVSKEKVTAIHLCSALLSGYWAYQYCQFQ